MPEFDVDLYDAIETYSDYNSQVADAVADEKQALQSAQDALTYVEADIEKYKQQYEDLKNKLPDLKRAIEDAETKTAVAKQQVLKKFADANNLTEAQVGDFSPQNLQDPQTAAAAGNMSYKLTEAGKELAKQDGKDPNNPEDVKKSLWERLKDHKGMALLGALTVIGVLVEVALNDESGHADWWQKNPDVSKFIPVGCVQYHLPSGSINTLGVCGVQKTCANLKTATDCGTQSTICTWDTNNNVCGPSDRIVNANSCCNTCGSNADCDTASTIKCSVDTDCLAGTCQNGYCTNQSCSTDTGTCSPCPSLDPANPILQQLMAGKLGFCLAGSGACSAANLICQTVANGGACDACPDNDSYCTNPGGTINGGGNCMCSGTDWVTNAVCATQTDLFLALMYMQATMDQWMPAQTPWTVTAMQILGIIGLIATFMYFVKYLTQYERA